MRFYIATGLERAAEHKELREILEEAGHTLTYDWTVHGSVQASPEIWADTAANEASGVYRADVVIVLLPGGLGTHTELGMALGLRKPIILVGEQTAAGRTCIFHHHPSIKRVAYDNDGMAFTAGRILAHMDRVNQ
jgi:nucleoside 2-deoxyribosyltransferase